MITKYEFDWLVTANERMAALVEKARDEIAAGDLAGACRTLDWACVGMDVDLSLRINQWRGQFAAKAAA